MNILFITHLLNGLLMVLMPIGLGIFLSRRFRLGWRLWWIGVATFVLSQVGHIPFNAGLTALFNNGTLPTPPEAWQLPFNAVVLGLSAGLWEELARYATYRWWAKDARSWSKGLMLGAGHGGIEAILLGVWVLLAFANMVVARNLDLSSLVPVEQLPQVQAQMQAYWSTPWYATLIGALERAFAIIFHMSGSLLVLQAFTRRQLRWLWLAVGWHTIIDGAAVFVNGTWGPYAAEGAVGLLALVSLAIIFALRQPEPVQPEVHPPAAAEPVMIAPVEETPENLEESRFQ